MTYSVYICDDNPEVLFSLSKMINRLFYGRLITETYTGFDAMLQAAEKTLKSSRTQLDAAKEELAENGELLESAETELAAAKATLAENKKTLDAV